MPLRYECDDPQFAGCFVEYREVWSKKQIRQFWAARAGNEDSAEWWALVRSKIKAVYLVTVDGDALTEPDQLTEEALDEIDIRLWTWLSNAHVVALTDLVKLGEALGRRLWDSAASLQATADRPNHS